jgi:hypothetical protein
MREKRLKGYGAYLKIGRKRLKKAIGQVPARISFIGRLAVGPGKSVPVIWWFLKIGKKLLKRIIFHVRNANRNITASQADHYSEMFAG